MKLPVTFDVLGDPITISEGKTLEGEAHRLGSWDERTGKILIDPNQHKFGKIVILIHEAMHVVETMMLQNKAIKRRVSHDFITGGAFGLATILVHAGAIEGVNAKDWKDFIRREARDRKPKRKVRTGKKKRRSD